MPSLICKAYVGYCSCKSTVWHWAAPQYFSWNLAVIEEISGLLLTHFNAMTTKRCLARASCSKLVPLEMDWGLLFHSCQVKELLYFYTSALNFLMVSTRHLLHSLPSRRHFDLPNRADCSPIFLILLQVVIAENSTICSREIGRAPWFG